METKKLDDLKGNEKNPRQISKHDFEALKKSIVEFGDLSGIVFNMTTMHLVGGHQRTEAFRRLVGDKQVSITQRFDKPNKVGTVAVGYVTLNGEFYGYREVEWPADREMAANIAANRIAGEWDLDLLAEANYMLHANNPELLGLTGQTDDEIARLLDAVGVKTTEESEDIAPELDETAPPISKLGEIYQLGRHRLMCGSSTDYGQITDLFDGATMALVLTDPPYGVDVVKDGKVGADFGVAKKGQYEQVIGDGGIDTAQAAWGIIKDLDIKKSIIWGGNYFTSFLPASGSWIVWDKRGDSGIKNTFADCELAWSNAGAPARVYTQLWNGMIREGEHDARVHPTQKPIKMLSEVLKDYSQRDDNIFDGFGGSGSTLIACDKMERNCYMLELSPAYVDVIRKRYAKHIGQEAEWQTATPVIQTSVTSE